MLLSVAQPDGGDLGCQPAVAAQAECPAGWAVEDVEKSRHKARTVWSDRLGTAIGCGRLDSDWCWGPQTETLGQWYQLDAGEVRPVGGVATGGAAAGGKFHSQLDYFVRSFTVLHSEDGRSWRATDGGVVYEGNKDGPSVVCVPFREPVWARFVRIYPRRWHREIALRMGLLVRGREHAERAEARLFLLAARRLRSRAWAPGAPAASEARVLSADLCDVVVCFVAPAPPLYPDAPEEGAAPP
eukprot:TRINITY_DN29642_c0_g1_i1.p3 TRINITY_DN29642_c0_g1~~TRINITY_DN29642_c0_g1_i1.p3  ORF type:complete len:242 (+),score=77.66 TRINITY_DN29642_c0_g1_i1:82-807(+)